MAWGEVFERLPPELTREETLFFDAVDLLIPACQLQYERMRGEALAYTSLHRESQGVTDPVRSSELKEKELAAQAMLMADAGSFVATVQRLRRVGGRLRGDQDLRPVKKAFEASIRPYEKARHHLEHLDTAISAIAPTGHGALGAMAWFHVEAGATEFLQMFIFPGHLDVGASGSIRMENSFRPPIDHIWSTIGGADYYLTGAADAVARLQEWSRRLPSD
jgi:hypothetical protein